MLDLEILGLGGGRMFLRFAMSLMRRDAGLTVLFAEIWAAETPLCSGKIAGVGILTSRTNFRNFSTYLPRRTRTLKRWVTGRMERDAGLLLGVGT